MTAPAAHPDEAAARRRGGGSGHSPRRRIAGISAPLSLLVAVGVAYALAQLFLVTPHMGLGWDEAVYASQLARGVPAAEFTAPRARGTALLVGPVVAVTTSVTALRIYLTVVSSLALVASFAVWLPIRRSVTVPVAALLFATTWLAVFYGDAAMPNLYVAFGAVAAVGCFVRTAARPSLPVLTGLGAALGVVALVRPSDSLWIAVPLVVAVLFGRAGRRLVTLAAVAAGCAVGWAEWVVEAYARFGGVLARLRQAAAENEGGLHFTLLAHARALNGPLLCRPAAACGPVPLLGLLWWAAIPPLAALGLWAARRERALAGPAMALGVGASIGMSYVVLVGYAAPRFLLPTYALVSLPVAEGLCRLLRGMRWSPRPASAALAGVLLLSHLAIQGDYLVREVDVVRRDRAADVRAAAELRALGVRPPCVTLNDEAVILGYLLACSSHGLTASFWHAHPERFVRGALAAGDRIAVVVQASAPPARFLRAWRRVTLRGVRPGRDWYAYLAP